MGSINGKGGIMTQWFSELASIVGKAAPLLGQALVGNYGAVAVDLIQAVFGGKSVPETLQKVVDDPDAAVKLKDLQDRHLEALTKLSNQDTEDARKLAGANKIRIVLMIILGIMLVADIIGIALVKDSNLSHILIALMGGLIMELKNVFKLYFGG
jgi:hypothetical protein